jgi:broad specificity phosphatase PhoE
MQVLYNSYMNDKNACTMYIVRHGQSEANAQGRYGMDTDLTELGRKQAKDVAEKFKEVKFDAVFSSPLRRAHDTAKTIAQEHNLAVITREALRERKEGAIDGRLYEEMREQLKDLYDMRYTVPYDKWKTVRMAEGWETDEELMGRFITELREIAIAYPGKTILIGSHVGLMKTLLVHLGRGTHNMYKGQAFKNTGYIVLKSDGVYFEVEKIVGLNLPEQQ